MFLFTTPPARDPAPANPVVDAIKQGAQRTGVGFDYLLATAQKESALDPNARAPSSSATGLFQFIEQTWLGLVKSEGPKHGLADYANAIAAKPDGSLAVPDPKLRQRILSLRQNPQVASVMAGSFTQRNRDQLAAELGREPSAGDLYVAHFLGARGAVDLIKAAQQSPRRSAARDFPDAAAANRPIFYDRAGRARGAGEVYAILAADRLDDAQASAAPAFAPGQPLAFARSDGPALHGLFRTDQRRGPISEEVAQLWRAGRPAEAGAKTAALGSFFPRSSAVPENPVAVEPVAIEPVQSAEPFETSMRSGVPLPPPRPASLDEPPPARPAHGRIGRPLDLSSFMSWRRRA
jgi:Transglycosylase SLT domain